jgi:hypothetical protein
VYNEWRDEEAKPNKRGDEIMSDTATRKYATVAGNLSDDEYEALCEELGFIAAVCFVQIEEDGSIGFTCGKPQEIAALKEAVSLSGRSCSAGLLEAAKRAG